MLDRERRSLDLALDTLARVLKVTELGDEIKTKYFDSLKKYSLKTITEAMNLLSNEYKPKRKDDFPVLADIHQAVSGTKEAPDTRAIWNCICCNEQFPAASMTNMKCGCDKLVCYRCWRCERHCQCPDGPMPIEEFDTFIQLNKLLASVPTTRDRKPLVRIK